MTAQLSHSDGLIVNDSHLRTGWKAGNDEGRRGWGAQVGRTATLTARPNREQIRRAGWLGRVPRIEPLAHAVTGGDAGGSLFGYATRYWLACWGRDVMQRP